MKQKCYKINKLSEYQEWLESQTEKSKLQIEKRLWNIEHEGHFGDHKQVSNLVWELKWVNGRRVYFAFIAETNILLLLGGNKNGQDKDISQAKKIIKKHSDN